MSGNVFYVDELSPGIRENNAGSKAREDVSEILANMRLKKLEVRYDQSERKTRNALFRIMAHVSVVKDWKRALSPLEAGDTVILQFPLDHHSIFAGKAFSKLVKRGARIILLIHDLDFIRLKSSSNKSFAGKLRVKAEELTLINLASMLIVHNESMKKDLVKRCGIDPEKVVSLEIFDYLLEDNAFPQSIDSKAPVVIAGNLRRSKAGYLYELPADVEFNLYGAGYEGSPGENVTYKGQFSPEELISQLEGSFGLIWDGASSRTCMGPFGEYLRLNNPHKTSLYLATGFPIIIWKSAALAPFVSNNGVGIVVSSLDELKDSLASISKDQYEQMKRNARDISKKLRAGFYTKQAINSCLEKLA